MGCGSSSLKGEKQDDVAGGGSMPSARKVKTNFSEVDFSGTNASDARRGTLAVAPDEDRRLTKVSEDAEVPGVPRSPAKSRASAEAPKPQQQEAGDKLEPYRSNEDITQPKNHVPQVDTAGLPSNDEAAALKTVGTDAANPVRT